MTFSVARRLHPGAVLAYAEPERALAHLAPHWLPVADQVRAVRRLGTRVLEYGCGTGRLTLALARAGIEVTGVDLSLAMLARLEAACAEEPRAVRARIRLHHGDLRDVALGERFPVVLAADGTVHHLYDHADFRAWLARVRQHLAPGGRLRLDLELPEPRDLAAPGPHTEYHGITQVRVRTLDGEPAALLAERMYFPAELRGLFRRAGAQPLRVRLASPRLASRRGRLGAELAERRLVLECGWDDD